MKMTPKSEALRADKEAEGKEQWQKGGEGEHSKGCCKNHKKDHKGHPKGCCSEKKMEYKEDHETMNK
jgi:hypothetical protein